MTDRSMDCEIRWRHGGNNVDISTRVISYEREQNICTGIGTLNLVVEYQTGDSYVTWDRIVLFEDGSRRGTYFIAEKTRNPKTGNLTIHCQDASKKLMDHFVTESYYIDYATYTKQWIEKFLIEAGVDYQFDVSGDGTLVSENSSIGYSPAYDIIMNLLQQSGWYMYVDNDNKVHVGTLSNDTANPDYTIRANRIISINTNKNDKSLRNRAVVWGNSNGDEWVFADLTREVPWVVNSNDSRAVVLANQNIRSSSAAYGLAVRILDEFATLNYEKEIVISGTHGVEIGNVLRVRSKYFTGEGLVTTVGSSMSASGLTTKVILDQRCPRLFGYFSYQGWVYVGTDGAGVWRKEIDGSIWENFSAGLSDYNVTDLAIKNGVFACTANGHAYYNTNSQTAEWEAYVPTLMEDQHDIAFVSIYVDAVACDIDDATNNIYFGYRLKPEVASDTGYYRSWIDEVSANGDYISRIQVTLNPEQDNLKLVDVDKHGPNRMAVAEGPSSYAPPDELFGTRKSYITPIPGNRAFTYGPLPSETPYSGAAIFVDEGTFGNKCSHDIEGNTISLMDGDTFKYFALDNKN